MTTTSPESKPSFFDRFQKLGSNLFLGLLVTVLSVFTAATNYATYQVSGTASGYEKEGTRLLADSNTEYIRATQFIIQDYTMYDGYYVQQDVDDFAAEYYQSNFSPELQASVERDNAFDDQYYDEMYVDSEELFTQAFEEFDKASAASEQEEAYQLAMLIAAVGLAFAAYASLLDEKNHLRPLFALMSLVMLVLSAIQFSVA
jgi:hypothetical protein